MKLKGKKNTTNITNIAEAMAAKTIKAKHKGIKFWAEKKTCEDQGWKEIDEGGK